jgi:hypothetical protein
LIFVDALQTAFRVSRALIWLASLVGLVPCRPQQQRILKNDARDCVKLAGQDRTPPELRDQLLKLAREWMHAVMDEEDGTETPRNPPLGAALRARV